MDFLQVKNFSLGNNVVILFLRYKIYSLLAMDKVDELISEYEQRYS